MDESCAQGKDATNGPGGGEDPSDDAGSRPGSPLFYRIAALLLSLLLHAGVAAAAFLFHDPAPTPDTAPTIIILTAQAGDGPDGTPAAQPSEAATALPPSAPPTPEKHPEPPPKKAAQAPLRAGPSPPAPAKRTTPATKPESLPVPVSDDDGEDAGIPASSAQAAETGDASPSPAATDRPAAYRLGSADTPNPPYPMSARRKTQQGQALIRLTVLPSGLVDKAELVESSGVSALDRAALDTLRRWRLQPALHAGEPVASRIDIPIKFVLE